MQKTFIALFLALNIIFSTATTTKDDIQKGRELFARLRDSSDIGKNLVETIQLEISTAAGEDQTIVSKVIELLREVEQSLIDQQDGFKAEVDQKNTECYAQVVNLKDEIKTLDDRISSFDDVLPLREDEVELKTSQLKALKEEVEFYVSETVRLDAKAKERKEEYEASKEEHDSMTAALVQAKRLIKKLSSESFLQKSASNLTQLSSHFEQSIDNVFKGHNKGFLSFLMQMSKVANQEQVQDLIQIIDDLIAQIADTARVEHQAESARVARYQDDRARLLANTEQADANVREMQADVRTAELRLKEAKSERDSALESRNAKQEQLDDHRRACDDQTASLSARILNFDEILDIIRQVLLLLEYSSIQGATDMVSDLDPNSQPEEESLLGDYNTDTGSLPNRGYGQNVFVQKQRSPLMYDPLDH